MTESNNNCTGPFYNHTKNCVGLELFILEHMKMKHTTAYNKQIKMTESYVAGLTEGPLKYC